MKNKIWLGFLTAALLLCGAIQVTARQNQSFRDERTGIEVSGNFADGNGVRVDAVREPDEDYILCKNVLFRYTNDFQVFRISLQPVSRAGEPQNGTEGGSELSLLIPVTESQRGQELALYGVEADGSYTCYAGTLTEEGYRCQVDRPGLFAFATMREISKFSIMTGMEQILLGMAVLALVVVNVILLVHLKKKK